MTDQDLLQAYALRGSENAFAELTQRYVDLVFSTAKRLVRDESTARDVTQAVFVALARNAAKLAHRAVLAGWLHATARNLAANAIRTEVRRRHREQESVLMQQTPAAETDSVWELVAPRLDMALAGLNRNDREAILLRYFQNKSVREVAHLIDTSEEAAQKRVNRAVERLRRALARYGVAAGASGLTVAISASAVQSAPIGLAAASVSAAATLNPAMQPLFMSSILQKLLATAAAMAVIVTIWYALNLQGKIRALERERAGWITLLDRANQDRDEALRQNANLIAANLSTERGQHEIAKLRAELVRLREEKSRLAKIPMVAKDKLEEITNKQVIVEIITLTASQEIVQQLGLPWSAQSGAESLIKADRWLTISNSVQTVSSTRSVDFAVFNLGEQFHETTQISLLENEGVVTNGNLATVNNIEAQISVDILTSMTKDESGSYIETITELGQKTNSGAILVDPPLFIHNGMKLAPGETMFLGREIPAAAWPADFTNVPSTPRNLLVFLTPLTLPTASNSITPSQRMGN